MTTTTTYLCIGCPLGCRLEVDEGEQGGIIEIRGFSCKRGKEYAVQEHTIPQRIVTTTVQIENGLYPRLPVRTRTPIPKALVIPTCRLLRTVSVTAPIALGEIILANVLQTGVDVIASRAMAVDNTNPSPTLLDIGERVHNSFPDVAPNGGPGGAG